MINCKNLRPEVGTGDQSVGRSVNNSGVVVGSNVTAHKAIAEFTVNADPWSIANAFVWTPNSSVTDGTIRNLGNFQSSEVGGGLGSGAWAVTNSNRIFGNSWLQGRMPDNSTYYATMGFSHSLSSSSTISLTDGVGVVAGARDSLLFDANQVGQAVGSSSTSPTSVLLYSNGGLTNLGSFGGIYAKGIGINDQGMIVGSRTIVVPSQLDTEVGFVWQPSVSNGTTGSYVDLGPITDSANRKWNVVPTAISSSPSPTVVGYMWYRDANGGSYEEKAFLWRQSTGIALLDNVQSDSTWKLRRANDVNSVGQIVGYGEHTFTNAQGVTVAYTRAFLLQPSTP